MATDLPAGPPMEGTWRGYGATALHPSHSPHLFVPETATVNLPGKPQDNGKMFYKHKKSDVEAVVQSFTHRSPFLALRSLVRGNYKPLCALWDDAGKSLLSCPERGKNKAVTKPVTFQIKVKY